MSETQFLTQANSPSGWKMRPGSLQHAPQGRGPTCVRIGGAIRYRLADVEAYEKSSAQQAEGESSSLNGVTQISRAPRSAESVTQIGDSAKCKTQ
jgi:hypothetical protein